MTNLQIRVERVVTTGPTPQARGTLIEKRLLLLPILWQSLQCMLQIGAKKKLGDSPINESSHIELP
jgi:hypothetical protein